MLNIGIMLKYIDIPNPKRLEREPDKIISILTNGNSIEGKFRRNLHLALCGKVEKNTKIKAGLKTQDIETVLQWSQTTFESSVT